MGVKANEFVKKFGWEKASLELDRRSLDGSFWFEWRGGRVFVSDLKRLVESHEIIAVGLPELKKEMFSDSRDLDYVKNWLLTVSEKLLTKKGIRLKQAVVDVESCQ